MKYPIDKYKIIVHQHPETLTAETIAISSYAGKRVKGKALCSINDDYNEENGILLAVLRCAEKIAKKREKHALKKFNLALEQCNLAEKYLKDMRNYYYDACLEVKETEKELQDLLAKM